jgi:uncharacterized membrane-anchored protein
MRSAPSVWILALALAAPLTLAADEFDSAAAQPESAAASVETLAGPVDLSLGAEARLSLPEGWHWVPKDRLQAYFGTDGRKAGAWDLGLALSPGQPQFEIRAQFEPLGAVVEPAGPLDTAALLAKVQAAATAANLERRTEGGLETQIPGWAEEPAYDTTSKRLVWGERRENGAEARRGWHARLLGKAGVLKLDAEGPADLMQLQAPLLLALFNSLSLAEGRGLTDRSPGDRAATVDLEGLVLAGTLGRGSLEPAAAPEEPLSPLALGLIGTGAALMAAWGAVAGWRGLRRWRHKQATIAAEIERLEMLEKQLGASADDVQEVHDDGSDAAAAKGDGT